MSAHLSAERLGQAELTDEELAHLAACVRCRAERRVAASAPELARPAHTPYALERWLGAGGMGVVYEARHTRFGTRHAVKLLRVPDPSLRSRLAREGRLQARLTHPNIVPIAEVIDIDGAPALVMPFIEGPTLAAVLERHRLPVDAALAVFRDLVRGVAEIHRAGLVHRDLKPANVLLDVGGDSVIARITDFGLAKTLLDSEGSLRTATGAVMGTPAYAAPEQLRDAATAGPPADVFALGAVLYELAAGARAYTSSARDTAPPLSAVPEPARALVDACLATDPDARPPDAVALAALVAELPAPDASVDLRPYCAFAGGGRADATAPPFEPSAPPPREHHPLFGRADALAAIDAALAESRFVVVVGPPGCGRTRVLVRYAVTRAVHHLGGASWIDAYGQPLPSPADAAGAARPASPRLVAIDDLDPREAPAVLRWLAAEPGASVVATATALGADSGARGVSLGGLDPHAAVALFYDRAASVSPSPLPAADPRVETLVVDGLGGVPLAIELCAARLRFAPLVDAVRWGFDACRVGGGAPGGDAIVDRVGAASVRDLGPEAADLYGQLSVFVGPFSVEAAEAVADLSAHADPPWVPDLLQDLGERALLRTIDGADGVRLVVPVALRPSAARGLGPDAARAARRRHAAHLADAPRPDDLRERRVARARMIADGEAALAERLGG